MVHQAAAQAFRGLSAAAHDSLPLGVCIRSAGVVERKNPLISQVASVKF
jgi:hypothetical protein